MAKIKQIFLLFCLFTSLTGNAQILKLGAERTQEYIPLLRGKTIGIVANQTSLIKGIHLVDSLVRCGLNIYAVFSPEHGFRGNIDAGEYIDDGIDKETSIPIISLYGKNKKPSFEQLKRLDIIVFDIQDVGTRFYTYLSTLHYVMEAAAENKIPVILLDRPNPNSHYIDGPVLEKNFCSFVGMHPVPIVYGMTIGEYAKMINNEGWLNNGITCDLTIIKMKNYNHNMTYQIPVKPSPNLPNSRSINLYPSLCLFEGTNISVGRGTDSPFQHFGSPYLKSNYIFIPKPNESNKKPKHENKKCFGTDLRYQDNYIREINLKWLITAYNESESKHLFFNAFFDKLAGTNKLRQQIIAGNTEKEIKEGWRKDLSNFKIIRERNLIYR